MVYGMFNLENCRTMKRQTGIWLDGSGATLVHLEDNDLHMEHIQSEVENAVHHQGEGESGTFFGQTHANAEKRLDERRKHQINAYLNTVMTGLERSEEILILGSGEAPLWLKNRIAEHNSLADRVRAVEPAQRMTENQLRARIKEFFGKR